MKKSLSIDSIVLQVGTAVVDHVTAGLVFLVQKIVVQHVLLQIVGAQALVTLQDCDQLGQVINAVDLGGQLVAL